MGTIENELKDLQEAQSADHDGRIKAREADHFINKQDGQWEPEIYQKFNNQPRYTIDLTSGIVADICGEMNSMDFDIKVRPAGGPATLCITPPIMTTAAGVRSLSPIPSTAGFGTAASPTGACVSRSVQAPR